jgi:hypothetical protein
MEVPQKMKKSGTIIRSSYSITRYIFEGNEIICKRVTSTPMFIAAIFTIAKLWKQLKFPSTGEWIKRM